MAFIDLKDKEYWGKLSNKAYWEKRSEELDKYLLKTQKELTKEMTKAYREAFGSISKEVNDFMMKYAVDHMLDIKTVQQVLSPIEQTEYAQKVAELRAMYKDTQSDYILKLIKELEARSYVTRQQALMDMINVELSEVAYTFQLTLEEAMTGLLTDEYAATANLLGISPIIPTEAVKTILEYPYHGKMFADSVWDNKDALIKHINTKMVQGIIRGESIQKMSKQLQNDLKVAYFQAERLIRTETNYAATQGHLAVYEESEVVSEYEVLAAIDSRTSKICRKMDGKRFKLKDKKVGVNCPPFHPNCRSTIIPVIKGY